MKILLVTIGVFLLSSCSNGSDWTAFVYPDIENIPNADQSQKYIIGDYRTFDECQTVAIERLQNNNTVSGLQGDYQCGYKCTRRDTFGGLLVCKETRK